MGAPQGVQAYPMEFVRSPASFRDPAGFVFHDDGVYKRAVTEYGAPDYSRFMESGLYRDLVEGSLLVSHQEEGPAPGVYTVLVPEQIQHISYSYEWSFDQLKDAALLTLEVQRAAMKRSMSLKDASSFNVQFRGPKPVFIDTLSFEQNDGKPWVAYGQFCSHFLAPLALMASVSPWSSRLLRPYLDGFPLDLASALLPASTWLRFGILMHIHLHARSQRKHAGESLRDVEALQARGTRDPKPAVLDSLFSAVRSLKIPLVKTEWSDYYRESQHYSEQASQFKQQEVLRLADRIQPRLVYDLGGNQGAFSRLLTQRGIDCVCYDADPQCVNRNYLHSKQSGDAHMLPLLLDLTNPTPALGFGLDEREAFVGRSHPDLVLALALIHHLHIAANIPLEKISPFLARLGPALLIEFVPKDDPMARKLMGNRRDIFQNYSWERFLEVFERDFLLEYSAEIPDSPRKLCLFRRRG
jgi:hypothetical protein